MWRRLFVIVAALVWLATSGGGAGATVRAVRNARGDRAVLWEPYRAADFGGYTYLSSPNGFGPLAASAASPAAAFEPFTELAVAPIGIDSFDVQVDEAGGAVATWIPLLGTTDYPSHGVPMVAIRPPGGAFGPPAPLPSGGPVSDLMLAVNASGEAMVLWQRPDGTYQYAVRSPGGTFGAAESISAPPTAVHPLLLTLDDNGVALGAWESGGGGPRVFYATRPAGGSFGSWASVLFSDPVTITAAGDRSGDGLLVGQASGRVELSERRGGGAFSVPATAFDDPGEAVRHVAITPAGDAAVVFEGERVEAAVRPAGGSFGSPTTIAGPGPDQMLPESALAADSRGDFAIGWRAPDHSVRFRYRPAGGRFGRPVDLAPVQPYSADTAIPPALALDGSGQGTAAWEHSDGERLSVLTSSFDAQHVSPPQAIGSISAYQRFDRPGACTPKHARVLLQTREATIIRQRDGEYGCSRSRGQPVSLDQSFDEGGLTAGGPPAATLAGPFAGYAATEAGHEFFTSLIQVTDLRDPQDGFNRSASAYGGNNPDGLIAAVPAVRMRPNGAIAWIACRNPSQRKRVRQACARPGGVAKRLFAWNTDGKPPRLLDRGSGIDARTLRLHGSTLTWIDAGRRHRATLQ